jgi:hypothetical protein
VKTAIAGEDANWGRVVMAVGKAGEPADRDKLSIWFNGIRVATRARATRPMTRSRRSRRTMKKPEIRSKSTLGLGKGRDRVLTCDLTKEYVAINGDLWEFPGGKLEPGERPEPDADPRVEGGTRHHVQRAVSRAADFRQPRL